MDRRGKNEAGPQPDLDITIGYFSDMTGPSSSALELVTMALDDAVNRYNERDFIPGVELKLVSYDSMFDPAIDAPTEIFVPNFQYTDGYLIELSDGSFEKDEETQTLRIFSPEEGPLRITLQLVPQS